MNLLRAWVPVGILVAATATLIIACSDDAAGPERRLVGHFAVAPSFASSSAGIIDFAQARFLLVRTSDASIAKDTVLNLSASQDSVDLSLSVALLEANETFLLTIQLITSSGDTAFEGGPVEVSPATSGTPPMIPVPFVYKGIGSDALGVTILTQDTSAYSGDSLFFTAMAMDSLGELMDSIPIAWRSLDSTIATAVYATISGQYRGRVIAGATRGTARILAELLTGQQDTVTIAVQPLPANIALQTGNGQTDSVGATLQSLVARVTAGDGQGVSGLWMRFAVTSGGGTLSIDSALTDANGEASTAWTLGPTTGQQVVTATVERLIGSSATFTATATAGQPANIFASAGDAQTAVAGSAVSVTPAVSVTDGNGNAVPGISVTFEVAQGSGSLTGTIPVTDATGIATVGSWTLGTVPGINKVLAYLTTPPAAQRDGEATLRTAATDTVTFVATGITGTPTSLSIVRGDAQTGTVGTALVDSLVVLARDANSNPTAGAQITFAVAQGNGTVSTDTVTTDGAGLAAVQWTLGTFAGPLHQVAATLVGTTTTVTFTAIATTGPPATLAFVVQPSTVNIGASIVPAVQVEILDAFSNRVTSDSVTAVDIAITSGTGTVGAQLTGTTTRVSVGGLVTFSGLGVTLAGTGYTLDASIPSFAPVTSAPFDVIALTGTKRWLNPVSGNWSIGANWSTGTPPGPTDTVIIDVNGTYTVTLDAAATVKALAVGGATGTQTLTQAAFILTVDSVATFGINGRYEHFGGTLTGAGSVVIDGALEWRGGIKSGSGITRLNGTGTISGAAFKTLDTRTFENAGSLVWDAGVISVAGGATFTNLSSGVFDLQGDVTVSDGGGGGLIANAGTFQKTAGAGTSSIGVPFDNTGSADVQTGTLELNQSGTHTGPFTVSSGAVLDFNGGTHTLAGTLTGLGRVDFGASTTTVNAAYNFPALFATGGGLVTFNGPVTVTDSIFVAGGIVTLATGDTVVVPRLFHSSGALRGPDPVKVTSTFQWNGGSQEGPASTVLATGVVSTFAGSSSKSLVNRVLDNNGSITWTSGNMFVSQGGQFANRAAGSLDWQGGNLLAGTGGSSFFSFGSVTKSGGATTQANIQFSSNGTLDILAGTIDVNAFFGSSGIIQGAGTLDLTGATIGTIGGAVSPGTSPGLLTIIGPFPQDVAATLNIELGGTTVGTGHDRLEVSGLATLSGALAIDTLNFVPAGGDKFAVLVYDSRSGDFPAGVTFPNLGSVQLDTVTAIGAGAIPDTLYVVASEPVPPGTNATWTGATSTDWFDASNWSPAAVPGTTSNVFLPSGGTNQPRITTGVAAPPVQDLLLGSSATLTMESGASITASGSVDAGASIGPSGTLFMTGAGATLAGTVPSLVVTGTVTTNGPLTVSQNLAVSSGTLTLGSDATVGGTGIVQNGGGNLVLAGNRLDVIGDFTVQGSARVTMTNALDLLTIGGNGLFAGDTRGALTTGEIRLAGSFTQNTSIYGFQSTGTKIVFSGSGAPQSVTMISPNQFDTHFQDIDITNPLGILLSTNVLAQGSVTVTGAAPIAESVATTLTIGGSLTTAGNVTLTNLTVGTLGVTGGTYAVQTTTITGASQTVPAGLPYVNLTIAAPGATYAGTSIGGTLAVAGFGATLALSNPVTLGTNLSVSGGGGASMTLGGATTIPGNLVASDGAITLAGLTTVGGTGLVQNGGGGNLVLGGNRLDVTGDFTVQNGARVTMTNALDLLTIGGNGLFAGDTRGALTTGEIRLAGSFTQNTSIYGFQSTGTKIVFSGSGAPQSVTMISPNQFDTHFQDIDITNPLGILLSTNVLAQGSVTVTGAAPIAESVATTLTIGGSLTTTGNVTLTNLTVGTLGVTGGTYAVQTTTITGASQTVPTGLPYVNLTIAGPGATYAGTSIGGTLAVAGFGATLTLSNPITLGTDLSVSGAGGASMTLGGATTIPGNLTLSDGALTLAGLTTVGGTGLVQSGSGNLVLAGNQLDVTGDFTVQGSARVTMTNALDLLTIGGNGLFAGDTRGALTAGEIRLAGSFTQNTNLYGFQSSGTKIVFNGTGAPQTVTMVSPFTTDTHFQDVDVTNPFGISLSTNVLALGSVTMTGGAPLAESVATTFTIGGSLTTTGNVTLTNLTVGTLGVTGGTYAVQTTTITGASQTVPTGLPYVNLTIAGPGATYAGTSIGGTLAVAGFGATLTLSNPITLGTDVSVSGAGGASMTLGGATTIPGNLTLSDGALTLAGLTTVGGTGLVQSGSGNLVLAGNQLDVTGDFTVQGSARVTMTNALDILTVGGNGLFAGDTRGALTAGEIRLAGDFTQNTSIYGFQSSGTKIVFNGSGTPQTVTMVSPFTTDTHFQDVEIANPDGIALASNVLALGQLIVPSTVTPIMTGEGNTMTVAGTDVDGLVIENVPLVINGGTITRFDFVTFQAFPAITTQLTVNHAGAATPFTFTGITFLTTPTTGFYISANDNVLDGNTLTIEMLGSSPLGGSAFEQELGGALVNWPGPAPARWTNASGGNWSVGTNWAGGSVPTASDDVLIDLAGIYTVTVDVTTTVVSLTVGAATGTQTLAFAGQALTVSGPFATVNGGAISMTGSADSLVVAGDASFGGSSTNGLLTDGVIFIGGNFTQSGNVSSYAPSGLHVTLLNGTGGQQQVSFTSVTTLVTTASHFHNIQIVNTLGASLLSNVTVTGDLANAGGGPVDGLGSKVGVLGNVTSVGDLNLQSLYLGGTLSPTGGYVVDTTGFFGIGVTIPVGLPYNNLEIDGTPLSGTQATLLGDLSITGNLEIFGTNASDLILNGNRLSVGGNFEINGIGVLTMTNAADTLDITGNALLAGASTDGLLTAGRVIIGGDFTQLSTTSPSSYAPSGSHVTEFLRGSPTISFVNSSATESRFSFLEIRPASIEATLDTRAYVLFDVEVADNAPGSSFGGVWGIGHLIVGRDLLLVTEISSGVEVTIDSVSIGGTLVDVFGGSLFNPAVLTRFTGASQTIPTGFSFDYTGIEVTGTATFAGSDIVPDNLIVSGTGNLTIGAQTITVNGGFSTTGSGTLTMSTAGGVLDVAGPVLFNGGSTSALLTAGAIRAAGDFTQASTTSLSSFLPTGTHVVELDGAAAQVIDFANPTSSTFNDLTLRNASLSGVKLNSDILIRQLLSTPDGATNRNIFGGGNTVTTRSASISNMTWDAAPLVVEFITGLSGTTKLDTLTFQNYATTDVVLTVIRQTGQPVFMANIFSTLATPTGGGAWIRLRDDDAATNGLFDATFALALPDPPPWSVTLTPWIVEENGATLSCWGSGCF